MPQLPTWTCAVCRSVTIDVPNHIRLFGCRPETSLTTIGPWRQDLIERFWSHVDWSGHCWLWTATVGSHGYGNFVLRKPENVLAHRFAAQVYLRHFDPALDVCHTCDTKRCVRPAHLWMGDAKANAADMVAKGRSSGQKVDTCVNGHPFSHHNGSQRICNTCMNRRGREYRARRKAAETGQAIFECLLCGEQAIDLTRHYALFHPDVDAEPEVWSDGRVAVIDMTITPEDFHG